MRTARLLIAFALITTLSVGCTGTSSPGGPAPGGGSGDDNGVSGMAAPEIATKATTALGAATSLKIKGEVGGEEKIALDLQVRGKDGRGTVVMSGQPVEVIRVGQDIYLKADNAFWQRFAEGQTDLVNAVQGKYLKVPSSDPDFGSLASYFDIVLSFPNESIERGETKVINGIAVVALLSPDPDVGGTLYVATKGQPFPIRLEGPAIQGTVDFTDYNTPVEIAAPAAGQFVDIESLPQPPEETEE